MAELTVVVVPRASRESVGPWRYGELRVRVTSPPAEGAANQAVVRAVSRALGVAPSSVELVSGERGRRKRLSVAGLSAPELEQRLTRLRD